MNKNLLNNLFQWGVMTAIVVFALPDLSFAEGTAGTSFGSSISEFRTSDLSTVPGLISGVAYAGGAVLGISGALKLKKHAENPAQNPMAPGIAHLLAGGGIAALPSLVGTSSGTLHLGTSATYVPLDTIS